MSEVKTKTNRKNKQLFMSEFHRKICDYLSSEGLKVPVIFEKDLELHLSEHLKQKNISMDVWRAENL